jgi:hypothetical protein
MIDNIETKLMPLEWNKKDLKRISYELNRLLELFLS